MTTSAEILSAALGLQPTERAEVAHQLLLSLEPNLLEKDLGPEWAEVIRQRLRAIRSGDVELREWDDVLADARKSIAEMNHP